MNPTPQEFSTDETNLLLNAIQLGIKSTVKSLRLETIQNNVVVSLMFKIVERPDVELELLTTLLPGQWLKSKYVFHWPRDVSISELTQFLMLTRLDQKNMLKLAEIDPRFVKYTNKLNLKNTLPPATPHPIHSIEQAAQTISKTLKEQNGTLRSLAEQCDLTQVALSRFKSGGDIRLSNFLKLAEALNLEVTLTPRGHPK